MKYSKEFERDFKWYLSMRHKFNFDGSNNYTDKKGRELIIYDKKGVSGKEAFYIRDSRGKIVPTKHPNLLKCLYKTKGSVNLHIKMYAEDIASYNWNKLEMRALCIKFKAPNWFREAIVNQSNKLRYG